MPEFVPVISDTFLASFRGPVNVPLILVRAVAGLPEMDEHTAELVAELKDRVEKLRSTGRARFIWTPKVHTGGGILPAGAVQLFFKEQIVQVQAKADLEGKEGQALLLDPNGALLLQGTLNLFIHLQEGDPESVANRDLARVLCLMLDKKEAGARAVELFAGPVDDLYGQETHLRAEWHVTEEHVSWQWGEEGQSAMACFDVAQATWVSGFLTLVRLAWPEEWKWRSGAWRR